MYIGCDQYFYKVGFDKAKFLKPRSLLDLKILSSFSYCILLLKRRRYYLEYYYSLVLCMRVIFLRVFLMLMTQVINIALDALRVAGAGLVSESHGSFR